MGVILEETGREGRRGDLRQGGGGGGVHTNLFAMIMFFFVFLGAVYMHLARCRLFMG